MGHKIPKMKPKSRLGEEAIAGRRAPVELRQRTRYARTSEEVYETLLEYGCSNQDEHVLEWSEQGVTTVHPPVGIPIVIRKR